MSKASYKVFMHDCTIRMLVGVWPTEKHAPQPVIVNVECESGEVHHFTNPADDSLDRAIDYTQIHKFVTTELPKMPHIPLLESVAELILEFCLRDPRVAKVRVRLEKPEILPDVAGVGIEVVRSRKE